MFRKSRLGGFVLRVLFLCLQVLNTPGAILSDPYIIEHPENKWVAKNEPASLTCKVEGKPPPVITWYRNGQPVITSSDDPESERMILPSGFLLIPRVSPPKSGRPDVGVYYCNATNPTTLNWVISRNATLDIAVLKDEFQELPQDTKVLVGSDTKIKCKPPKGEPEPKVKWKKDAQPLEISGRVFVNELEGSLNILEAKNEDSGRYTCIAFNAGGEKESRPATLTVREKPQIVNAPKDIQVKENEDVLFECLATGEPTPTINWARSEGTIPTHKAVHTADGGLRLSRVQTSDEDVYRCTAQNEVGVAEVEAKLIVQSPPLFLVTPQDKVVGTGREVQLSCIVTGNPQPAIFWKKENIKNLMLQGESYGPFSVLKDGSLLIRSAIVEDSGEYTCQALSTAGAALSKARLVVKETYNKLPPIITTVPQNQTLPTESKAILSCSATGDPSPSILWFRKDRVILPTDPRFTVTESGTLIIEDLRRSDSGVYTCRASSESGDTSWSAHLNVPQSRDDRIFRAAPQPSAYPGPPSRPMITEVTETTARVSWKRGGNVGLNADVNYIVQAFCFSEGPGWITVASGVQNTSLIVSDLKPNSFYSFIVRANNSLGIGAPSPPSLTDKTRDFKRSSSVPQHVSTIIDSHSIFPLNSSAINVSWSLTSSSKIRKRFDGIQIKCEFIKYLTPSEDEVRQPLTSVSTTSESTVEYVYSPSVSHYVITGLRKFSLYELSIRPFLRGGTTNDPTFAATVERFNTLEDVPSSSPLRIQAFLLNNNTFLRLSWKPPQIQDLNGRLIGYKIHVSSTDAKHSREMLVNSSVDSIEVYNLVRNVEYRIQLQAFNRVGDGPKSPYILPKPLTDESSYPLDRDNYLDFQQVQQKHLYTETWFLGVVFAFIGCIIWLSLCVFCVLWYKRKKSISTSTSSIQPPDKEVKRMLAPTNRHPLAQGRQEKVNQQMTESSGSKKFPLLRYHHHHQAPGSEQTSNLCHNCNNTLMTSCCYNESISDGECCRSQQQQQQQQQQHSPAMNHTYHTLDIPVPQHQQQQITQASSNNNSSILHINNSSVATNRPLPTSHSGSFQGPGYQSNYHTGHQSSSPVLGNYNFPNSTNVNSNNNNYNRSFRPISRDRNSFLQHSSDEEIKTSTMMAPSFQPPILFLPPPPPIEDDHNEMFAFQSDAAYYNELPIVAGNYTTNVAPSLKAQMMECQVRQRRNPTEGNLGNPFYDKKLSYQWEPNLSHRDSDYDEDTETYNGTVNEEGHRSSSDDVSSIEEDSRFINDKVKGLKKQNMTFDLMNLSNKKSREFNDETGYEMEESFKPSMERCSDDIPRNVIRPLSEEPAKVQ